MKRSDAKSRGRPRQADADESEMKGRIVAAARELFLRDGVEAVSMRNLASEVGCSPMWLYRYFGNKQEILSQVWDVFFDELFARLTRIRAASPRAYLEELAFGYFDYWMEYPDRFMIVFLQKDLVPGGTRNYVEASDAVGRFELFIRVVEDAKAKGEIGGPDAGEIARGLLCRVWR
jgi:AcrR family transcriptional regulator